MSDGFSDWIAWLIAKLFGVSAGTSLEVETRDLIECARKLNGLDVCSDAQREVTYDELRDAFESLDATVRLVVAGKYHRESVLTSDSREALIGRYPVEQFPFRDLLLSWLRNAEPWTRVLDLIVEKTKHLSACCKAFEARTARTVKDAIAKTPSNGHLRQSGIEETTKWVQDKVSALAGREERSGAVFERVSQVRGDATLLPERSRKVWLEHSATVESGLKAEVVELRVMLSTLEVARRALRLDDAVDKLLDWLGSDRTRDVPKKAKAEGKTKAMRAKLDQADARISSLGETRTALETLQDWLETLFVRGRAVVPSIAAAITVAFSADQFGRALNVPALGSLSVGWDFFDFTHPERIAALALIAFVAIAFFDAQLQSIRKKGRLISRRYSAAFVLGGAALPFVAAWALFALRLGSPSDTVAPAPQGAACSERKDDEFDCYDNYRLLDRAGDLLVLACGATEGKDTTAIFVPREKLDSMKSNATGVCVRRVPIDALPPAVDLTKLSEPLEKLARAWPKTEISVRQPEGKDPEQNIQRQINVLLREIRSIPDGVNAKDADWRKDVSARVSHLAEVQAAHNGELGLFGDTAEKQRRHALAEARLTNCLQVERSKKNLLRRGADTVRGNSDDVCYPAYFAEIEELRNFPKDRHKEGRQEEVAASGSNR